LESFPIFLLINKKLFGKKNNIYLCNLNRKIIAFGDYYSDFMEKLSAQERLKIRRACYC